MNLQQAKEIVKQHMVANNLPTMRQAFDHMCVYKSKLPIYEFVAVDIIGYGYSDYAHLVR